MNQSAWTTTTPPGRLCRTASPRLATSRTSPAQLRCDHNIIESFLFSVLPFYTVNSGPKPHAITAHGAVRLMVSARGSRSRCFSRRLWPLEELPLAPVVDDRPTRVVALLSSKCSLECVCQAARSSTSCWESYEASTDVKEMGIFVLLSREFVIVIWIIFECKNRSSIVPILSDNTFYKDGLRWPHKTGDCFIGNI